MTITVPPELEKPLNEQARAAGMSPETLAIESLRASLTGTPQENGRRARVRAARGSMALLSGFGSDDFARRKQEDKVSEERA